MSFGRRDLNLSCRSLKWNDRTIIDGQGNLNIVGSAKIKQLTVATTTNINGAANFNGAANINGAANFNGNVSVNGILKGGDQGDSQGDLVLGNTVVSGVICSAEDQYTLLETSDNANVTIAFAVAETGLDPLTVVVTELPAAGTIQSIHPSTGDIEYRFDSATPPQLDAFRYTAKDKCGLQHSVTQLISLQPTVLKPFIRNGCFSQLSIPSNVITTTLGPFDLTASVLSAGDGGIDWTTLTIQGMQSYTADMGTVEDTGCPAISSLNYGSNDSTVLNGNVSAGATGELLFEGASDFSGVTTTVTVFDDSAGGVSLSIDNDAVIFIDELRAEYFIRTEFTVDDANGNESNKFFVDIGAPLFLI